MCNQVMVISPCLVCMEWLLPLLLWVGGSCLLLSQLFPNHPIYMVGHTALGAQQRVTWSLCLPYMMGKGLLFQVWCYQMTGWWVYLHLVCRGVCCLLPHLSWVHWQGVIINPLSPWNQGVRIMPFWIRLLLTSNKDWTPSSLIHSRHRNWTLPWMSLISLHLQSLLGFSTQLVPFLIILSYSLLLAFELINCGARLGLFLHLCLWLPRCQHLNWFITFLATLQPLDSRPLLHQITSPRILLTGKLISLSLIFRLVLVLLHMLLLTQSNSSLTSGLPLLILFAHCLRLREVLYLCLKYVNYFSGFITFWTRLFPSELETQLTF